MGSCGYSNFKIQIRNKSEWCNEKLEEDCFLLCTLMTFLFIFKGGYTIYFLIVYLIVWMCMCKFSCACSHCFQSSIQGTCVSVYSEQMTNSCCFVIERITSDNITITWITMQPITLFECMPMCLLFTWFMLYFFAGLWTCLLSCLPFSTSEKEVILLDHCQALIVSQ